MACVRAASISNTHTVCVCGCAREDAASASRTFSKCDARKNERHRAAAATRRASESFSEGSPPFFFPPPFLFLFGRPPRPPSPPARQEAARRSARAAPAGAPATAARRARGIPGVASAAGAAIQSASDVARSRTAVTSPPRAGGLGTTERVGDLQDHRARGLGEVRLGGGESGNLLSHRRGEIHRFFSAHLPRGEPRGHRADERGDPEQLAHQDVSRLRALGGLRDGIQRRLEQFQPVGERHQRDLREGGGEREGETLPGAGSTGSEAPGEPPQRVHQHGRATRERWRRLVFVPGSVAREPSADVRGVAHLRVRNRARNRERSCALFSSCTRRTALVCRVSASTFARSQKCCSTCPGTSRRTIVAARVGAARERARRRVAAREKRGIGGGRRLDVLRFAGGPAIEPAAGTSSRQLDRGSWAFFFRFLRSSYEQTVSLKMTRKIGASAAFVRSPTNRHVALFRNAAKRRACRPQVYARARGDASPKDDCSAVCTRCSYLHASSQTGTHARELSVNPSHDRHDVAERAEERAPQRRAGTCLPRETDAREGVFACARRVERIGSLLPRSGRTPSTPPGAIVAIRRRRATERRRIPE